MPEPGMGGKSEQDGYGGRDPEGRDAGSSWGDAKTGFGTGMKYGGPMGGLLGGLYGYAASPHTPKSMATPGEEGYDTRDGGNWGGMGGGRGGGISMGAIMRYLQQNGIGGGQQGFQFAPPAQGNMPQIAPPGGMPQGQGPQNINDLYSLYGSGPSQAMPQQAAPPQYPGGFGPTGGQ